MNSYRKALLLLLDVIVSCDQAISRLSQDAEVDHTVSKEIYDLTLDIAAAVPYHLADNVQVFFDQTLSSDEINKAMIPGRSVGGLLLMHTLYMVSTLPVVDPAINRYCKDCLAWIGRNMGIGQATMLSQVKLQPIQLLVELTADGISRLPV